jgi:hypothetical protein
MLKGVEIGDFSSITQLFLHNLAFKISGSKSLFNITLSVAFSLLLLLTVCYQQRRLWWSRCQSALTGYWQKVIIK